MTIKDFRKKYRYVVLCLLLLLTSLGRAQSNESVLGSPLEVVVKEYSVTNMTMREALQQLREYDRQRIVLGFEELPEGDRHPVSVNLVEATVGDILRNLCDQDPRYTYSDSYTTGVINVFPAHYTETSDSLMTKYMFSLAIDVNEFPQNVIRFPDKFIPNLRIELAERAGVHVAITPESSRIYSLSTTNVQRPRIRMEIQRKSLREILNEIVVYSRDHMQELRFAFPLSWRYQPVRKGSGEHDAVERPTWDLF